MQLTWETAGLAMVMVESGSAARGPGKRGRWAEAAPERARVKARTRAWARSEARLSFHVGLKGIPEPPGVVCLRRIDSIPGDRRSGSPFGAPELGAPGRQLA